MPLNKQQVTVNFAKGLDTKSDPWQVPIGNFLELKNSVFSKQGQLKKRNGYGLIGTVSDPSVSTITTFNGELTAIGNSIYAYNDSLDSFVNKGRFQPVDLSVIPGLNNGLNQIYSDSAESPNELVCLTYTEEQDNYGVLPVTTTTRYKFSIINKTTGQNVVAPQEINPGVGLSVTGPARAFVLGNNFIVVFTATSGLNNYLKYVAINYTTLSVSAAVTLTSNYLPATPPASMTWDGVVVNGALLIGYNSTALGGFYVLALTSLLTIISGTQIDAANQCTIVSACADATNAYFSYYDSATGSGYIVGVVITTGAISTVFAPQQWILTQFTGDTDAITAAITNIPDTSHIYSGSQFQSTVPPLGIISTGELNKYITNIPTNTQVDTSVVFGFGAGTTFNLGQVKNIATTVSNGFIYINSEIENQYAYTTATTYSNLIYSRLCSTSGVMSGVPTQPIKRGVGLASKAFVIDDIVYFLVVYSQGSNAYPTYQSGYYLIDSNGNEVAKLAYTTGGGYLNKGGLPSVTINGANISCSYLIQNLVRPIAKTNNAQSDDLNLSVYTQTGINIATFNLNGSGRNSTELGSNLNINAGFLWGYDGYQATENGFFVYPDTIEIRPNIVTTGNIPPGDYFYVATYEWTDNQGNIFRSAPSIPVNYEIKPGVVFNGDTNSNDTITNIASTSNLQVGMGISGAGIPLGATITQIISATSIRISPNATATAAGVALTTTPVNCVDIYVPNLRLTYKSNVSIVIYRYSANVPVYYQVTSITKPYISNENYDYTVVLDNNSETGILPIVGNNILYTTGGVLENISCPAIKTTTIFDNRLWGIDSEKPNLLWYSKQVIQNTPVEMSDFLTFFVSPTQSAQGGTGPITAIAPMDDKLIIFKKDAIYYINGTGPNNTGSNSQFSEPIFITSTVGTENQNSIVLMPQGLMFQSDKGIWLLGRNLSTVYIGAPVEAYTEISTVKSALAIPESNQVRFTMSNNITLMYDYFFEQWGTFNGIPSIFSTIYQGLHTYLMSNGRVLQETPGHYTDDSIPTVMGFKTNWFALGGILGFQRAYFMFLLGKYISPHKLVINLAYDFNNNATQTTVITPNNYNLPFGDDPFYGSTPLYGGTENVERWRIMFQRQKCDSVQITINEVYDPSFGEGAGAGLTLSGINLIVGVKKIYNTVPAALTAG